MRGFRVGALLKLVAVLAIGLALARGAIRHEADRGTGLSFWDEEFASFPPSSLLPILLQHEVKPLCASMAWVGGLATWWDWATRRPRRAWGAGRWFLATWAVLLPLSVGDSWFRFLCLYHGTNNRLDGVLFSEATSTLTTIVNAGTILPLFAAFLVAKLARWPGDPAPDFMEWCGRIAWGLLLLIGLGGDYLVTFLS